MTMLDEPLLPEDKAAQELKVQKQTMAAWRNRGQGPAYVKIGRLVFYRPSHLKERLESRVVRPEARRRHEPEDNDGPTFAHTDAEVAWSRQ
jgi:Helix-turn-helix domain